MLRLPTRSPPALAVPRFAPALPVRGDAPARFAPALALRLPLVAGCVRAAAMGRIVVPVAAVPVVVVVAVVVVHVAVVDVDVDAAVAPSRAIAPAAAPDRAHR